MSVRHVKEKAAQLIASGHFERAEVLLRQALTQSPRDVQSWLKHAEVLKRLGRNLDAISNYRLAARILDDDGHHQRAVAALKLALSLVPDDIDLITDIIRLEMRARRTTTGVRSVFPLSSPSQLLSGVPASSESSLYEASSASMLSGAEGPAQLALPMISSASPVPRRLDTWVPEGDLVAPTATAGPSAGPPEGPQPSPDAPARGSAPTAERHFKSVDARLEWARPGLPLTPIAIEDVAASGERVAFLSADEPTPRAAAPADAALEGAAPLRVAQAPDAPVLEVEVERTASWPQVRRLSERRVGVRAAPGAPWVVVESAGALEVRFEAELVVPDDAEWLE